MICFVLICLINLKLTFSLGSLNYDPGFVYVYDYESILRSRPLYEVILNEASSDNFRCQVELIPQFKSKNAISMKMLIKNPIFSNHEVAQVYTKSLTKFPLYFQLDLKPSSHLHGQISHIHFIRKEEKDFLWSLNLKRTILSAFQIQLTKDEENLLNKHSTTKTDQQGLYSVVHTLSSVKDMWNLTKVQNKKGCDKSAISFSPLNSKDMPISYEPDTRMKSTMILCKKENIVKKVIFEEHHEFKPFGEEQMATPGVNHQFKGILTHLEKYEHNLESEYPTSGDGHYKKGNLLFQFEKDYVWGHESTLSARDSDEALLNKMLSVKENPAQNTGLFINAAAELTDDQVNFLNDYFPEREWTSLLIDLYTASGRDYPFSQIREVFHSLTVDEKIGFLMGTAYTRHATHYQMNTIKSIAIENAGQVRTTAYLSLGSKLRHRDESDSLTKAFLSFLKQKLHDSEDDSDKILFLTALGNAAQESTYKLVEMYQYDPSEKVSAAARHAIYLIDPSSEKMLAMSRAGSEFIIGNKALGSKVGYSVDIGWPFESEAEADQDHVYGIKSKIYNSISAFKHTFDIVKLDVSLTQQSFDINHLIDHKSSKDIHLPEAHFSLRIGHTNWLYCFDILGHHCEDSNTTETRDKVDRILKAQRLHAIDENNSVGDEKRCFRTGKKSLVKFNSVFLHFGQSLSTHFGLLFQAKMTGGAHIDLPWSAEICDGIWTAKAEINPNLGMAFVGHSSLNSFLIRAGAEINAQLLATQLPFSTNIDFTSKEASVKIDSELQPVKATSRFFMQTRSVIMKCRINCLRFWHWIPCNLEWSEPKDIHTSLIDFEADKISKKIVDYHYSLDKE